MPNPIIGVFSDIPQSNETSAGSSAAQNTQRYKEIEQIAKYNRDNNTNFYTLAQIQEHQKKLQELERAKTVASNPDPEDVRDAYISALNPQTTEDVDKIRKWDKDAATTNGIGLAIAGTIPEMATFGVVPGLARYGLGLVTGHYGSQVGASAGNWLDNKLNTKVFSPALGFVGGLAGYGMGADMVTGIGRIPLWKTYKPLSTNAPQLTGHFGQVKYYGPTMGKTTAAKSNPKIVDFDDIIRQPSRSILDRFGFKNKAEMYNSGNQEAIKAYEDMLVKSLRDWRANPENSNLTLVASPTAIANPTKTGFYFDNIPSIPSRSVFIARNVGRGETPEASAMWYDSLMEKNPNLKIDNRFVSEIEKQAYITPNTGYKSIFMEEPIMSSSKAVKSGKNHTKFFVPSEYDIIKASGVPEENLQLMEFAKKYNYKLPIGIERYSGELLEKAYKKLLAQHNTYGRSVSFRIDRFKPENTSEEIIKAALLEGKRADLSGRGSMFYNSWGQPIDIKANERLLYLFPSTSGWKPTKIYGDFVDKRNHPIRNIYSLYPNEKIKFKPREIVQQAYEGVLQEPLDFSGDIKTWIRKNDPAFTYSGEERINLPIKDRKFFFDDPEYYAKHDGDRYWIGPQVMRIQTKDTPKMIIKNIFKPYGNTYGVEDPYSLFAPGDKEVLKKFKVTKRGFSHKRINPKIWERVDTNGNIIKSEKQGGKIKSIFNPQQ